MDLDKRKMLEIIRAQLAIDMNCSPQDFIKDGVTFNEAVLNEGRRMFDRQSPYLEAATMGAGIVVNADSDILPKVKAMLEGKPRDDLFFAPLFFGHSLYYIPDLGSIKAQPCPEGFVFKTYEDQDVFRLYEFSGFDHAILYDENNPRPDVIAICAMDGDKIAGIAGASADCALMWQIGIDVLPGYRGRGIAASLVSNLAMVILERDIVPYYGTASSNIASQMVAHRSGFEPAWMCTYKNTLGTDKP